MTFVNLLHNENIKIFRRMGTWIMVGVLLLFVGASTLMSESTMEEDWQKVLQEENQKNEQLIAKPGLSIEEKNQLQQEIALNEYRLSHNEPPYSIHRYLEMSLSFLINLVTLFAIIYAGTTVAGEFSSGTIKLLLMRPHRRVTVLLTKYLALLCFIFTMVLVGVAALLVVGGIRHGFEGILSLKLVWQQEEIASPIFLIYWMKQWLFSLVNPLAMMTLSFMISTIFRSSSLAIGLGLFSYFLGSLLSNQLAVRGYEWVKYFLFTNTDLTLYFSNMAPPVQGMTFSFSLTVVSMYLAVFLLVSFVTFKKRDIAS